MIDMYAFDSKVTGFNAIRKSLNGVNVLLNRDDIGEVLLNQYSNINLLGNEKMEFKSLIKIEFLELMLTSEDVVKKMSQEQKSRLSEVAYKIYCEKENSHVYGGQSESIYQFAIENNTIEEFDRVEQSCLDTEINQNVKLELYSNNSASLRAINKTYIRTPNGSKVTVSLHKEYADETIKDLNESYRNSYPNAIMFHPSSNKYNCHSYAWYRRSKYNSYWMNEPEAYITDGSYVLVGKYPTETMQKVVWYDHKWDGSVNLMHSGIVLAIYSPTDVIVESKWTDGPVMIHPLNYSPYNGLGDIAYYKRN